jgi:uncharacterized protein YqhQ
MKKWLKYGLIAAGLGIIYYVLIFLMIPIQLQVNKLFPPIRTTSAIILSSIITFVIFLIIIFIIGAVIGIIRSRKDKGISQMKPVNP